MLSMPLTAQQSSYVSSIDSLRSFSLMIPLDEVVPGGTVRIVVIGGRQYLSIRDIIMNVCGTTGNRANEIWARLGQDKKDELNASCGNFKFPGRGQSKQPVITFQGALQLIMLLPGEVAKKHRSGMVTVLTRYLAGDQTLIRDIEANGSSNSPICQLAREELESSQIDDVRKRKHGVLDDIEMDSEKRRENQEYALREVEIQERRIACVERLASMMDTLNPEWKHDARICRQLQDNLMISVFEGEKEELCMDTTMDERARQVFKDSILSNYIPKDVGTARQDALESELKELKGQLHDRFSSKLVIPKEHFVMQNIKKALVICENGMLPVVEESLLYDVFMDSIPLEERLLNLEAMFSLCNPGRQVSPLLIKRFHDKKRRIYQAEFGLCLETTGGQYVMRGPKRFWKNVRPK
jgi:hypothetical protein